MGAIVERGGILGTEHHSLFLDPFDGRFGMGVQNNVHGHLRVLKKAVSAPHFGFAATGFGDVGPRRIIEVLGQSVKPLLQPLIIQTNGAELFFRPVAGVFHRRSGNIRLRT